MPPSSAPARRRGQELSLGARPGREPLAGPVEAAVAQPRARPHARGRVFVDLQNDQTAQDIYLAVREGYRSIEHIKRYTAMGFGTDQGKLGNINGAGIAALPGSAMPNASAMAFMVLAVPIVLQCPSDGAEAQTRRMNSS